MQVFTKMDALTIFKNKSRLQSLQPAAVKVSSIVFLKFVFLEMVYSLLDSSYYVLCCLNKEEKMPTEQASELDRCGYTFVLKSNVLASPLDIKLLSQVQRWHLFSNMAAPLHMIYFRHSMTLTSY